MVEDKFILPNSYKFGGGFNITSAEPVDARIVVKNIDDVLDPENWVDKGVLYNGLMVSDANGVVKVLINAEAYTSTESWVEVGAKGYEPHFDAVDPSTESTYPVGQVWVNTLTNKVWVYVGTSTEDPTWQQMVTPADLESLGKGDMTKAVYDTKGQGFVDKAEVATKLETTRDIELTGDATGKASFDGSANASIAVTLKNSGVSANTYTKVTVDEKGIVTGGANLTAEDIPTLTAAKISDLGTAAKVDTGVASGNVPVLDEKGQLPVSTIPAVAITDVTVVDNREAMLAQLNVQKGDVTVVTKDEEEKSRTYILAGEDPKTFENWKVIDSPDAVSSVNGKTGDVALTTKDVTEDTNLYYTDARVQAFLESSTFVMNGGGANLWDPSV